VGELLDHLEQLGPDGRRALLDAARERAGLPRIGEVERQESMAAAMRAGAPPLQRCAVADCATIPTNGLGIPTTLDIRRWHCPAHEHLALPGDMQPHGSGLRITEGGALVPVDADSEQRDAVAVESRQRQREAADADRAVEAAAAAEHRRALDEALDAELPTHLRGAV
jgi:hypothetical protein